MPAKKQEATQNNAQVEIVSQSIIVDRTSHRRKEKPERTRINIFNGKIICSEKRTRVRSHFTARDNSNRRREGKSQGIW
jgi:hypothetical protein